MAANLGILALLAGCHGDEAENPFDDWGPYKGCEQTIVYTDYDLYEPDAGPYPGGETVNVYTPQGGLLQSDHYVDWKGTAVLVGTMSCSYDESTHAPLECESFTFYDKGGKPVPYSTETYGYRADGLLAWEADEFLYDDLIYAYTWTRDESDRIVRVDAAGAHTDEKGEGDVTGVPDSWAVWMYDANSELTIYDGDNALPNEVDTYADDHYGREVLTGVYRYTIENHEIVHSEQASPDGDVDEVHDYTYDDDHHLLTDVRDDGVEISTYTYDDRGFWVTGTRQVAWKSLSDLRTDYTAEITYDCEAP